MNKEKKTTNERDKRGAIQVAKNEREPILQARFSGGIK